MAGLDLQRLDPEIAREAVAEKGAHVLRCQHRAIAHRGGTLAESEALEAVVAEGLVALPHRLAEAVLSCAPHEGMALLGVAGDPVEDGSQQLGLPKALRIRASG